MNYLNNKKILLIICGGISAYKSLDLIRLLKKNGSSVKTILTKSAEKFVTPLSIVSLSQEKIYTDIFDYNNEAEMDHISLSRWADIVLIVPATANTIAKLSNGIADDLATTVVLASNKKIFLAPAMNVRMWEHVSNKHNVQKIREFGYNVIGPDIGDMACGEYGEGKMSSVEDIFNEINKNLPADVAIISAAVSDFKIDNFSESKNKKSENMKLNLKRNSDILNLVSKHNSLRPKLVIGFSAETDNLEKNSKIKLNEKNCDWIIANDVSNKDIGFNSDFNEVSIFYKNRKSEVIPKMKKALLANEIVEKINQELN